MTKICIICKKEKDKYKDFRRGNQCRECLGKLTKEWKLKNRDSYAEKRRKKYSALPKEVHFQEHLRKSYKLSLDDYKMLLLSQKSRCKICLTPAVKGQQFSLRVDHCHKTGVVRGLLCNRCNVVLGFVGDNIDVLKKMIQYLKKYDESICE